MIDTLLLATTNHGKTREIRTYLADLPIEIISLADLNINETFKEKGHSFIENARGKSLFYCQFGDHLTLSEDSGLEIEYLKGAPGVKSARFSGPDATDEKNISKVLGLMDGVPDEKCKAKFVSYMVLSQKLKLIKEILGIVEGCITKQKRGSNGFGYDPIFFHPPSKRTFAELLPEEKNQVSHRGQALKQLKQFLIQYIQRNH